MHRQDGLHAELNVPLVCVAVEEDDAEALAHDLCFFLGGEGSLEAPTVLRIPGDDLLPYDELSPDGGIVAKRLGALFHLVQGTRVPAVVVPLRALMRKVLPADVVQRFSAELKVGEDHEPGALARRLSDMGYASVPLVEVPGTFSLRGGILDVYSPLYERPIRLEFFGDTIESMRSFDAQTQRTVEAVPSLRLPPAREILFNDETRGHAETAVRAAAENADIPTSKVRERLEQIREGMRAVGMEALLPGFFKGGLGTVFDYLPKDAVFYALRRIERHFRRSGREARSSPGLEPRLNPA